MKTKSEKALELVEQIAQSKGKWQKEAQEITDLCRVCNGADYLLWDYPCEKAGCQHCNGTGRVGER